MPVGEEVGKGKGASVLLRGKAHAGTFVLRLFSLTGRNFRGGFRKGF